MNTHRPVSIPHLVLGLVFTGIAAVWAIGRATDADLSGTAIGFPVVIVVAGIVGLVASVVGSRSRARAALATSTDATTTEDTTTEDTTVLDETTEPTEPTEELR
jgi:hypothetical protein